MPLCCMGHHHSLEPWYKEKASHQNLALYLYKSGSAEDPSRPRRAQCVSIPTTAMHLGGVNQMHRLAWEATLSPVLFPVSVHQAKQCSATSCLAAALPSVPPPRAGACTSSQPPHLRSHRKTPQELLRNLLA